MASPSVAFSGAGGPARFPARLPRGLIMLAVPSLFIGLLGMFLGFTELSGALQERHTAVERVRDAQLMLYDTKRLVPTLQQLPRADVERLALLLGDERFERRGVAVPMALLSLLASWLLLTGTLGTLRRQGPALPLWRFACFVNMPLTILSMLVTMVHARELMDRLGPPLAEALAKVNKHDVATELRELASWTHLYVMGWGVFYGGWVLWLALTVAAIGRHLPAEREA